MDIHLVSVDLSLLITDFASDIVRHSGRHESFELRKWHFASIQAEDGNRDAQSLSIVATFLNIQLLQERDAFLLALPFIFK